MVSLVRRWREKAEHVDVALMSKESDGPVVWTLHLCLWGRAKVYMQKLHITCPHVKAANAHL